MFVSTETDTALGGSREKARHFVRSKVTETTFEQAEPSIRSGAWRRGFDSEISSGVLG